MTNTRFPFLCFLLLLLANCAWSEPLTSTSNTSTSHAPPTPFSQKSQSQVAATLEPTRLPVGRPLLPILDDPLARRIKEVASDLSWQLQSLSQGMAWTQLRQTWTPLSREAWARPSLLDDPMVQRLSEVITAPKDNRDSNWSFFVEPVAWMSTARTNWSIGHPSGSPNILSELKWQHMHSALAGLRGQINHRSGWLFRGSVMGGNIQSGVLTDLDFYSSNRQDMYSYTESRANSDNVFIATTDFGYTIMRWPVVNHAPPSTLTLLIGYQYWRERYRADQTVIKADPYNLYGFTGPISQQGLAISEEFEWHSLRLGFNETFWFHPRLALEAEGFILPVILTKMEDIHHLRADSGQNPTLRATTANGFGAEWSATLRFQMTDRWQTFVGYQWWHMKTGEGTATRFFSDGTSGTQPFNGTEVQRQGVLFGIRASF